MLLFTWLLYLLPYPATIKRQQVGVKAVKY